MSQGANDKLDVEQAAHRLARVAALGFCGEPTKKPRGFGRAGSRTDHQTVLARDYAQGLLAAVPTGEVIAFTDGASRGNPGPAGAGVTLYVKDSRSLPRDDFAPLGINTNNLAELWAIGIAVTKLATLPADDRPYKLNILTDSSYSIGCLDQGFVAKTNRFLIRALARGSWPPPGTGSLVTSLLRLVLILTILLSFGRLGLLSPSSPLFRQTTALSN